MPKPKKLSKFLTALMLLVLLLPNLHVRATADKYPWRDELFGQKLANIQVDGYAYYADARSILAMVNELRGSLGLHPLVYNAELEAAAMLRAAETSILWSHMRPDGSFIYYTPPYNAENIAAGNSSPEATFMQWVNSPSHYEAMVNPNFISIGIGAFGTAKGEPPLWWSQIFSAQVGGTEFADKADVEVYRPEISLAPAALVSRPKAMENGAMLWEQSFEDGVFAYRLSPGRELILRPYVHYKFADPFQVMTLFTPDSWEATNLNPEIIENEGAHKIRALSPGQGELKLALKAWPEQELNYYFQVLETKQFGIEANFRPDLLSEQQVKMREDTARYFAQKASENAEIDFEAPDLDKLQWDSRLAEYALEVCKHSTLCESSTPVEDFPKLQASDDLLDPHANYWWSYFSSEDKEEDRLVIAPVWAKSYALAILESGDTIYTAVVFSDLEGDGLEEIRGEENLRYPIEVYEDRTDFELSLQKTEFTEEQVGDYPFELELLIEKRQGELKPVSKLDSQFINFTSLSPEIIKFNEQGQFKALQNGLATVQVELLDAKDAQAEPLMSTEFTLKIELKSLETEAPTETAAKSGTSQESVAADAETAAAENWRNLALPAMILLPFLMLLLAILLKRRDADNENNDGTQDE
ncbi:MAG: CAP domain-containing protein [Eubacteriales bacterium]|nr:CAP domain-containing protein [Eubacteriales bacterium]